MARRAKVIDRARYVEAAGNHRLICTSRSGCAPFGLFRAGDAIAAGREVSAETKENVIVSASYYGWPADSAASTVNDVGQIDLGREQHDIDGPGNLRFTGSSYVHVLPRMLKGPPEVNINVYSGRRTSPDNLLDCDIFQNTMAVAHSSLIVLHCKLLTENVTH